MIQRIQTVFLALAAIASTLMLIPFKKMPLLNIYGENSTLNFHSLYIENLIPGEASPFSDYFTWPLAAMLVLITFLSIIAIFLYKNRSTQMLWIKINILLTIFLVAGFFFGYVNMLEDKTGVQAIYHMNSFIPALILFFLILAYRGVKKDDKLIKSMDRIR
ncbi:MAG: DUF4293 domain-containing protein [Bacteroidales bacterium]|nr:DUF4293 domain-containing protein [Bacteroidales bacterium]